MSAAPIAYVAHAISGPLAEGPSVWREHLADVHQLAAEVARAGFAPIVPTAFDVAHREALRLDHSLVQAADVIVVHTSRWASTGVARELRWAREMGMPIITIVRTATEAA